MTTTKENPEMTTLHLSAERVALLAEAEASVAQWPQYAGHFDAYVVARVRRRITHRGAVLPVGTLVLLNPASIRTATDPVEWLPSAIGKTFVTIWFPAVKIPGIRNVPRACDTVVRADYLEVLG